MFGILIASIGMLFDELSSSIGKVQNKKNQEGIYTMAFLFLFWSFVFFGCANLFSGSFRFNPASLPTFTLRAGLEILQIYASVRAITQADRTTYSFFRLVTIPLLLAVDIFIIGIVPSAPQMVGITLLLVTLSALTFNGKIDRKGLSLVLLCAVNAASTISLYKFNITHYNSVAAEQFLIIGILLAYSWVMAYARCRECPPLFLRKPIFFLQSALQGAGSVIVSFAYVFSPASIVTTAIRASAMLWAIATGSAVFHEKKVAVKILAFFACLIGIVLLAF